MGRSPPPRERHRYVVFSMGASVRARVRASHIAGATLLYVCVTEVA